MFIRKRLSAHQTGRKGCDQVEMYFDPCGKESVVDRVIQEGYCVVHKEVGQEGVARGDGPKVERECGTDSMRTELSDSGLELEHGSGSQNGTDDSSVPEELEPPTVPSMRRRGLMSMVTSALKELEIESA